MDINKAMESVLHHHVCEPDWSTQPPTVAIPFLNGLDSLVLILSCMNLGIPVSVYAFKLHDYHNPDVRLARYNCERLAVPLTVVPISGEALTGNVWALRDTYGCRSKVAFEVTFPFLYLYPAMKEEFVVVSNGAHCCYGHTREAILKGFRLDGEQFNAYRLKMFGHTNPASINQQKQLADTFTKVLIAPYLCGEVKDCFMTHRWEELNKPLKAATLTDYADDFAKFHLKVHRNARYLSFQKTSGVSALFETLLKDADMNVRGRKRVVEMVKDWVLRS